MIEWFNWKNETGEMIGSFTLTFAVLLAMIIVHRKKYGIDTVFKKRMFMGVIVALAVLFSATAAVGFGGFGQINPGITLMVAAIEGHWNQVPAIIGFQLIGSIMATIGALLFTTYFIKDVKLNSVFNWTKQSVGHTVGIEVVGNIFWFLPIAGYVLLLINQNGSIGNLDYSTFGHFQLALTAAAGKFILVGMFEEFGAANFNAQIWFGKMLATIVITKKLPKKPVVSELSGLLANLSIGIGLGYLANYYLKH
ncbi:hypothetical protein [Candidatus Mycoplasma mahonii]|uniref:hypothetical protein n=1 Tax=Candidatus Mycoplasma mahonii TaxID=3004105 RepID=UPI0026ECE89F|nr:hypothetical protein [Candidatus Mycoplasma mahonii]WKX02570.1 hypothetical protein O3I44_00625 [Candidatus Mycoplasma mahonii]